jgi:hypothetical protein
VEHCESASKRDVRTRQCLVETNGLARGLFRVLDAHARRLTCDERCEAVAGDLLFGFARHVKAHAIQDCSEPPVTV